MARRRKFRRDVVEESTSTPFDMFRESRLTNVGSSSHCVKSLPVHLDSTTVLLERRSRKVSEEPRGTLAGPHASGRGARRAGAGGDDARGEGGPARQPVGGQRDVHRALG